MAAERGLGRYLGFYLSAWAPFALLALLAGWRGLISPFVAVGLVPALTVVTLLVQATPSTAAAAPVLLSGAVLIACLADTHLRRAPAGSTTVPLALAVALFVVLVVAGGRLADVDSIAELSTFTVIFASIAVEALPFVLLGAPSRR